MSPGKKSYKTGFSPDKGFSLPELLIAILLISIIAFGVFRFYLSASSDSIMGRVKFIMNQRSQIFLEKVKNDLQSLYISESAIESDLYVTWLKDNFPSDNSLNQYRFKSFDMSLTGTMQKFKEIEYAVSNGKISRFENGLITFVLGDKDDIYVKDFRIIHYQSRINTPSKEIISPHWFRIMLELKKEGENPLRDASITIVTSVGPRQLNGKRNFPHWQALNQFLGP